LCWPQGKLPNRMDRGGLDGSPSGRVSLSLKPDRHHRQRLKLESWSLEEISLGLHPIAKRPRRAAPCPGIIPQFLPGAADCQSLSSRLQNMFLALRCPRQAGVIQSPVHPRDGRVREDRESTGSGRGSPWASWKGSRRLICLDKAWPFGYILAAIFPGMIRLFAQMV
jgi:hypothetical protein